MTDDGRSTSSLVEEDMALGDAVEKATDLHFDSMSEEEAGIDETGETTPEGDLADNEENLDEEEVEGEEESEEGDETEDLEDETTEDDELEGDDTPRDSEGKFQKRFTKLNPNELPEELKPIYRSMQGDYTRKLQEAADMRREAQDVLSAVQEFENSLNTPAGLTDLIIQSWLADPDTFRSAIERIDLLQTDEREREIYQREQELKQREARTKNAERKIATGAEQQVLMDTISKIQKIEEDTGLPYDMVEEYLTAKLVQVRSATGGAPATAAQIDRILDDFRQSVGGRIVRPKPKPKTKKKRVKTPSAGGRKKVPSTPPASKPPVDRPSDPDAAFEQVFEQYTGEAGLFK